MRITGTIDKCTIFAYFCSFHIDHCNYSSNRSNSFLQVSGVQEQDMQKPDYLASVIPDIGFKYDVFVLEVKKRRKQSNRYFSDLVKTGKEMKRMVDAMVELGVESPAAFGIVVAGIYHHAE